MANAVPTELAATQPRRRSKRRFVRIDGLVPISLQGKCQGNFSQRAYESPASLQGCARCKQKRAELRASFQRTRSSPAGPGITIRTETRDDQETRTPEEVGKGHLPAIAAIATLTAIAAAPTPAAPTPAAAASAIPSAAAGTAAFRLRTSFVDDQVPAAEILAV